MDSSKSSQTFVLHMKAGDMLENLCFIILLLSLYLNKNVRLAVGTNMTLQYTEDSYSVNKQINTLCRKYGLKATSIDRLIERYQGMSVINLEIKVLRKYAQLCDRYYY